MSIALNQNLIDIPIFPFFFALSIPSRKGGLLRYDFMAELRLLPLVLRTLFKVVVNERRSNKNKQNQLTRICINQGSD